ncbi:MAG TPA: hypothetical protein VFZ81_10145 [Burkholderiales bacterium]
MTHLRIWEKCTAFAAATAFLTSCAAPAPPPRSLVPLLEERPAQPHEVLAHLEARGDPGAPVQYAYDELRWKANAMGADAIVKIEQRSLSDEAPVPYDPPDRPLMGNAYPGPLHDLEPGAFPPEGRDLRARGRYYVVEGVAIRYRD